MRIVSASTLLLFILCGATAAQAAIYTVGASAGCQFASLQAAIDAAQSNPTVDEIQIDNTSFFSNQNVTINAQDLTLDGGWAGCSGTPSTSSASLRGTGGAQEPVIKIRGSGVKRIVNLIISNGDQDSTEDGGGIDYSGRGELVLRNVSLNNNYAGFGGGINFEGSGGDAFLTIEDNVIVQSNIAQNSGGGIRIEGSATLNANAPGFLLFQNTAIGLNLQTQQSEGGYGGGMQVRGSSKANIGSPGFGNLGVFNGNTARFGGGLSAFGFDVEHPEVRLYTTVATKPISFRDNRASEHGGAIHFRFALGTGGGFICSFDHHWSNNRARDGSAIYSQSESFLASQARGNFVLSRSCAPPGTPSVACTLNQNGCNVIENHATETSAGAATAGATFFFDDYAQVFFSRQTVVNNRSAHLVRSSDADILKFDQNVMAANIISREIMRLNFNGGDFVKSILELTNNTIANNSIGGNDVIYFEDGPNDLDFNYNLIWQPNNATVRLPFPIANSPNYNWDRNAGSDFASFPQPDNRTLTAARFISNNLNNYRLRAGSRAINLWPAQNGGPGDDLDDRTRNASLAVHTNTGIRDVGAYERQESDPLILNGGFVGNLSLWEVLTNAASYGTANASGSQGGSVLYDLPPVVGGGPIRVNVLRQCFNVPGPDTYLLSGAGGSQFNPILTPTGQPILSWAVRSNGADCTGAVLRSGNLSLPTGTGLNFASAPAQIPIAANEWTENTTIEVLLVAEGNSTRGIDARFDEIRLRTTVNSSFTVGGSITGLTSGTSIRLINGGVEVLTRTSNGPYQFGIGRPLNASYTVFVGTQPAGRTCRVSNAEGTILGEDVTNVNVLCLSSSDLIFANGFQ
jgi:predicted outer membrane repeat protein